MHIHVADEENWKPCFDCPGMVVLRHGSIQITCQYARTESGVPTNDRNRDFHHPKSRVRLSVFAGKFENQTIVLFGTRAGLQMWRIKLTTRILL